MGVWVTITSGAAACACALLGASTWVSSAQPSSTPPTPEATNALFQAPLVRFVFGCGRFAAGFRVDSDIDLLLPSFVCAVSIRSVTFAT
jgi:hypothetical protein